MACLLSQLKHSVLFWFICSSLISLGRKSLRIVCVNVCILDARQMEQNINDCFVPIRADKQRRHQSMAISIAIIINIDCIGGCLDKWQKAQNVLHASICHNPNGIKLFVCGTVSGHWCSQQPIGHCHYASDINRVRSIGGPRRGRSNAQHSPLGIYSFLCRWCSFARCCLMKTSVHFN